MPASLRLSFLCFLAFAANFAHAAEPMTLPIAPPVTASTVLAITFQYRVDGENHRVVVMPGPSLLRVDEPDDGFSIIYDPQTDHYTGLEHRNYTYWEFSWPEVRVAVEASKRYETHLQDLGNQGLNSDYAQTAATNNAGTSSASASEDNSGYVWRPTNDRKRIAGIECVRWTGDTLSGENVEAWCSTDPLPRLRAAVEQLRIINEPIALVPVRTIVPPFIFTVYDGLLKGGVTPVLISWGGDQDKNSFTFANAKLLKNKSSLFTVPKLYIKTTLITMDGMIDQKK